MPVCLGTVGDFVLYFDSSKDKPYILASKDFNYHISFESEYLARRYANKLFFKKQKSFVLWLGR